MHSSETENNQGGQSSDVVAEGNVYEPVTTARGVSTFRHVATGELLHGQAGPWQEAWALYVEPARITERSGHLTVFDVGMGCAAQVFATLEAFAAAPALKSLRIVSFDLENHGLASLLKHQALFAYVQPWLCAVQSVLKCGSARGVTADEREWEWVFVPGDFRQTVFAAAQGQDRADLVYFDFFSPASHPHLWSFSVVEPLARLMSERASLATYSCSTAVRAVFAATGLFLGYGVSSGKKARTTVAARRLADLEAPLPREWLQTFLRSHQPFLPSEEVANRSLIRNRLLAHPQFI